MKTLSAQPKEEQVTIGMNADRPWNAGHICSLAMAVEFSNTCFLG